MQANPADSASGALFFPGQNGMLLLGTQQLLEGLGSCGYMLGYVSSNVPATH